MIYHKQGGGNESLQTVVGINTITLPSTTQLKANSSNKSDSRESLVDPYHFLSRNIGSSTFDK